MRLLKDHFSSNDTVWQLAFDNGRSCPHLDPPLPFVNATDRRRSRPATAGYPAASGSEAFYAFITPFIILIGLAGNLISVKVFSLPQLRKLSSSHYLTAISISDSLVLATYVLLDWLNRGLPLWPGGHRVQLVNTPGMCQAFLFASYTFRFVSVWLIVLFTVERYFAVCRPFYSRLTCTRRFARRAIVSVVAVAAIVSLYKPLLSGVYAAAGPGIHGDEPLQETTTKNSVMRFVDYDPENRTSAADGTSNMGTLVGGDVFIVNRDVGLYACRGNPSYDGSHVNFVMDVFYGLLITAVPFVPIGVLNISILFVLVGRDRNIRRLIRLVPEKKVRLEFTINLLAVSASFLGLNVPYFVLWCQQFVQSFHPDDPTLVLWNDPSAVLWNRDKLLLAKAIFYVNYAINFILYSLTGAYYRSALVRLFSCAESRQNADDARLVSFSATVTRFTTNRVKKSGTNV